MALKRTPIDYPIKKQSHQYQVKETIKSNYRTKPCLYLLTKGDCRHGDNCKFSHECENGLNCMNSNCKLNHQKKINDISDEEKKLINDCFENYNKLIDYDVDTKTMFNSFYPDSIHSKRCRIFDVQSLVIPRILIYN